jgi:hypothetical protein
MKSKLLILLLFLYIGSVAQSVPNTDTFSLSDVNDVVGGVSLSAAFSFSVDAYFDPAYKGSKDRLSNFRNYTIPPQSYYAYRISIATFSTSEGACSWDGSSYVTVYSADPSIIAGSTQIWHDTNLTDDYTPFGYNPWLGISPESDLSSKYAITGYGESNTITTSNTCFSILEWFDPWQVRVTYEAQSVTITFSGDANIYDLTCADAWFSVNKSSVTGNDSFIITFSENTTGTDRLNEIEVRTGGVWVTGFQVRQDAQP